MGNQPSNEESRLEAKNAVRVKCCVDNLSCNINAIGAAIDAQTDMVGQLVHLISDSQQEDDRNNHQGIMATTKNLLANIQNTLILQSYSLRSSFDVLNHCLKDIIEHSRPNLPYCVDTQPQRLVHSETHHPKTGETDNLTREHKSSDARIADSEQAHSNMDFQVLSDISVMQEENKSLRDSVMKPQCELNEKQHNIREAQKAMDKLQTKYTKQGHEMERLRAELTNWKKEANAKWAMEMQLRQTQKDNKDLHDKVRYLELMKHRKKSIPVQLYYQRRGELMTMVVEELSAMLNTHMDTRSIVLDIKRCENSSDIQPDKPLLVLCINASRIGTDAAAAIQGIQQSKRTALLIFHHKNIHALPSQPSDRMLTAPEFVALGGIYDMAFLKGKGIYSCNMNEVAIIGIEHFIQQYMAGQ